MSRNRKNLRYFHWALGLCLWFAASACLPEGESPTGTSNDPYSVTQPWYLQGAAAHFDTLQYSTNEVTVHGSLKLDFQINEQEKIPLDQEIELTLIEKEPQAGTPKRWLLSQTRLEGKLINHTLHLPVALKLERRFPIDQSAVELYIAVRPKQDFRIFHPLYAKVPVQIQPQGGSIGSLQLRSEAEYSAEIQDYETQTKEYGAAAHADRAQGKLSIFQPLQVTQAKIALDEISSTGGNQPETALQGYLEIDLDAKTRQFLPSQFMVEALLVENQSNTRTLLAATTSRGNLENLKLRVPLDWRARGAIPYELASTELWFRISPTEDLGIYPSMQGRTVVTLGIPGQSSGSMELLSSEGWDLGLRAFIDQPHAPRSPDYLINPLSPEGVTADHHGFTVTSIKVSKDEVLSRVENTEWPNAYSTSIEICIEDSWRRQGSRAAAGHLFTVAFLGQTRTGVRTNSQGCLLAGPFELKFNPFERGDVSDASPFSLERAVKISSEQAPYINISKSWKLYLNPWEEKLFYRDFRLMPSQAHLARVAPRLGMNQVQYGRLDAKHFRTNEHLSLVQRRRYWMSLQPQVELSQNAGPLQLRPLLQGKYGVRMILLGRASMEKVGRDRLENERIPNDPAEVLKRYTFLSSYESTVETKTGMLKLDDVEFDIDFSQLQYMTGQCLLLIEISPLDGLSDIPKAQVTTPFFPLQPSITNPLFESDASTTEVLKQFAEANIDAKKLIQDGKVSRIRSELKRTPFEIFQEVSGVPSPTDEQIETLGKIDQGSLTQAQILQSWTQEPSRILRLHRNLCDLSDGKVRWISDAQDYRDCKANPLAYFRLEKLLHLVSVTDEEPSVLITPDRGQLQAAHIKENALSDVNQVGDRLMFPRLGSHWDAVFGLMLGRGVLLNAEWNYEHYIANFAEHATKERNQIQSMVLTAFHQQEVRLEFNATAITCTLITQLQPSAHMRLHVCASLNPQDLKAEPMRLQESWYFITPDQEARLDAAADSYERSWWQMLRGEDQYNLWQEAMTKQTSGASVFYADPLPLHTKRQWKMLQDFRQAQDRSWDQVVGRFPDYQSFERQMNYVAEVFAYGTMAGHLRRPISWHPTQDSRTRR